MGWAGSTGGGTLNMGWPEYSISGETVLNPDPLLATTTDGPQE
jgi:hypothetical protein